MPEAKSPLDNVWVRRMVEIGGVPELHPFRAISNSDLEYLLQHYPYLQIVNSMALFSEETPVKMIKAKSGWTIHDYGEAISASPGEDLYGGADAEAFLKAILENSESIATNEAKKGKGKKGEEGDEGSGGADELPGRGTIIKQMVDTAIEMVKLAMEKGWAGFEIVAGTRLMSWAAWSEAQDKKFEVIGFEATEEEREKRNRIAAMHEGKFEEQTLRPEV